MSQGLKQTKRSDWKHPAGGGQETSYCVKNPSHYPRRSCQTRRVPTRAPHSCRQVAPSRAGAPSLRSHLPFNCGAIQPSTFRQIPGASDHFPSSIFLRHHPRLRPTHHPYTTQISFFPHTPRVPEPGRNATPHFAPRRQPRLFVCTHPVGRPHAIPPYPHSPSHHVATMENLASSGTPVVASQGKVKAFFDQWRQNKRAQQQGEADTPSKTADPARVDAGSPSKTPAPKVGEASSSDVAGSGSPASARVMPRSAQAVEGARAPAGVTTSALKLISQLETSSKSCCFAFP